MRKIEEFNKTQMLMDEFKKLGDKGPEIDNQIEQLNRRTNLTIERLEDEMKSTWEDVEFNLDRKSIEKEYKDRIAEVKKNQETELEDLNKQKEESENAKKEFYTDENAKTITMEIKDMEKEISAGKLEIKKKEIELQQKDIELQEFYDEQEKENPLRWQEIYNEKDAIQKQIDEIKANIDSFEKKIEEYSNFKQEIFELKYPKITVELDENAKVEPKVDPIKVDPTKVDPTKVDPTKVDSIKADPAKADPAKADPTKVDPAKADPAKADPAKADPAKADPTKADPTKVDPIKADPIKAEPMKANPTKVDPTKADPKKDPKPNDKIDLKDVKIIIGKKGLTVKAPGLDQEDNHNEIKLDLRELKDEADYWIHAKIDDFRIFFNNKELSYKDIDDMDPNILSALSVIYNSDVDRNIKNEILSRYLESIQKEGDVSPDKSLKEVIEYDRTDLDYLKPRNFISRLIHKEQFEDMKYYADKAEEMGIAEIKPDKPGWIRQLVSNMKNKVKLLGTGDLAKSEEYQNAKTQHERDQLIAYEKYARRTKNRVATHESFESDKNGKTKKTSYDLGKDGTLKPKKVNLFKKGLENLAAKAESDKKHPEPVVKSDKDTVEKTVEEEVEEVK